MPPIVEKHYEFCAWLIEKVEKFPKDQRFLLGDRIERHALDILEMLIEAALTLSRDGKAEILRGANVRLEHLRYLMRLAKDGKYININSFHFACERMEEIGRMIGGWIKSRQVYEKSMITEVESVRLRSCGQSCENHPTPSPSDMDFVQSENSVGCQSVFRKNILGNPAGI